MALATVAPLPQYFGVDGDPLDGGRLFFGVANQNPLTNPLTVYWDAAATIPAAQPVRTINGYTARNGTPALLYAAVDYSVLVLDRKGRQVLYAANSAEFSNSVSVQNALNTYMANVASTASHLLGAGLVGWDPDLMYQIETVGHAMRANALNALWYGLDNSGATDNTARAADLITTALAQKRGIYWPGGTYLFNGGVASGDGLKNGMLIPFGAVNFDPREGLHMFGDAGRTVFKAGANNMIVVRNSRNNTTIKDITIDGNSGVVGPLTNVYGIATVPEDMVQIATLVSNSFYTEYNVSVINCTEGRVFQPGPEVGGSESGCFFHNIFGGLGNLNWRHVWTKKSTTWATDGNRPTRTSFFGLHLLRGNCGYYLEEGSEINLKGCSEELIAHTGGGPLVTPTARFVGVDANSIYFYGGASEACTAAINIAGNDIVTSYGYVPLGLSGTAQTQWRSNVAAYDDQVSTLLQWTPVLSSSGGGAEGASTSVGWITKQGKEGTVFAAVSAAKGTLGAGSLSVNSLSFLGKAAITQFVPAVNWGGITFTANNVGFSGRCISNATLNLIKQHIAGGGAGSGLTVAECADPITFTLQGRLLYA